MTESSAQLLDGSAPLSAEEVLAALDALGIAHSSIHHEAMRTVEDSKRFRGKVPGGYSKNLFLRNKKGRMWLVTLDEDREVDLKALGALIGAGRPSFASAERLMAYLGVWPGAVTPLSVINDKSAAVTACIDAALLEKDPLHFHPCDNRMTTTLSSADLLKFMRAHGHEPLLLNL